MKKLKLIIEVTLEVPDDGEMQEDGYVLSHEDRTYESWDRYTVGDTKYTATEVVDNYTLVDGEEGIEFEYDEYYWGGEYSGIGDKLPIPTALVERVGSEAAFQAMTGLDPVHIISEDCNPDVRSYWSAALNDWWNEEHEEYEPAEGETASEFLYSGESHTVIIPDRLVDSIGLKLAFRFCAAEDPSLLISEISNGSRYRYDSSQDAWVSVD